MGIIVCPKRPVKPFENRLYITIYINETYLQERQLNTSTNKIIWLDKLHDDKIYLFMKIIEDKSSLLGFKKIFCKKLHK